MKLLDTNVIIRYLLNEKTEQTKIAVDVIGEGAYTLPLIIAEVVYVLTKLYNTPRETTADILLCFIQIVLVPEKQVVAYALELYKASSFSFPDCVLIAYNHLLGADVFSFDKKLNNRLIGC